MVRRILTVAHHFRGENRGADLGRWEYQVETTNGRKVRGSISVSEARIVPELEKFSGMTLNLVYGIDVTGLRDGDSVDGSILLSTNLGEYTIPVHVEIRDERVKSSAGEIRDLAAFADLARENYEEAFRLFTGPSFAGLLEGEDAKHLALYRGLIRNPVTYHRLEEFLVGCGLKQPVSFTAEKTDGALLYITPPRDKAGHYKAAPQHLGQSENRCGDRRRLYRTPEKEDLRGGLCRFHI